MTPEERAVVQAAIRAHRASPLSSVFALPGSLGATVQTLILSCNECNTDTHRCGCGNVLQHGDTVCWEHECLPPDMTCSECIYGDEDPAPWCDCLENEVCKGPCRRRAHSPACCPSRAQPEPEPDDYTIVQTSSGIKVTEYVWRAATFLHILAGDKLRIGTDTAEVIGASANLWHASVQSQRMMSGKWWDNITPFDHIEVQCVLDINGSGEYTKLSMSPDVAVEIECDAERAALLILQQAFPGTRSVT